MKRFLLSTFLLALIVLVLGGVGGYFWLRSSLPQLSGVVSVRGARAEIRIVRDADGVPTIIAEDDAEAAFGLGFAHAQDRLFQMELMRRYGAGRLSEVFGERALPADRLVRVLGLYRLAEAEIPALSPEVVRALQSYAAGVNAFLAARRGALPPEFLLLRFAPEPWRVADSLVWGKLIALQLGGDYRGALLRARLARSISAADLALLYPGYPEDGPTTISAAMPEVSRQWLDHLYAMTPPIVGPMHASNNWVVDGKHSASGKPLVANDPHLGFSAPGFWYLARLKTPQQDILGGTAPGVPLVIVGHNERIAWGLTTTGAAIEDLFVEKLDPADPQRYLTPHGSTPFVTRSEHIAVRGGTAQEMTVRQTRHGPVLSDILPPGDAEPGYVLALQATFLDPEDKSAQAIWRLDRAQDWGGFRDALQDFVGPPQNIVYGDNSGTIGFMMPGRVPVRGKGEGWLPAPGWSGDYDWTGFIPFAELPNIVNPASGRIVSANNRIVPKSYPYFIGRGWDLPDRAERIDALLAATPVQTPEASAAIQGDTYSLMAKKLVPLMTQINPREHSALWAVNRLRTWDYQMDADRVAPLIFTSWLREFSHAVLFGRFGEAIEDYWDLRPQVMETVLTWRPDWCGGPGTKDCSALLEQSLDRALDGLRATLGSDRTQWRWGNLHRAIFENAVLARVPVLNKVYRLAIASSGGYDTIDRGTTTIRDANHPYEQRFGAGLRMIADMAQPQQVWFMSVPGQSGNPLSPHYADFMRLWRDFDWLVPGREPELATLLLVPQN